MTLARPWVLHFLWLVPLAALALVLARRRSERALARYAEAALLPRLAPPLRRGTALLKTLLAAAAVALMVLAGAGPRWGSHYQEVSRRGVDIMAVVDVSRSMQVEDVKPDRLERARREILDLLAVVEGDRLGLVAFAGAAFLQCPLTLDYAAVELFLADLAPGLIPVAGTDLGAALRTALAAFDREAETDRVILLITDGEDHEGHGLEAAREAAAQGVRVFVFGIGDPSGGPVPETGGGGGFLKDNEGKLVLSRLDESTLQKIADATGGRYVRSVTGDLDLDLLYFSGIRPATEARELKSGKIKVHEERFTLFLVPAFLLLLLEGIIRERGSEPEVS